MRTCIQAKKHWPLIYSTCKPQQTATDTSQPFASLTSNNVINQAPGPVLPTAHLFRSMQAIKNSCPHSNPASSTGAAEIWLIIPLKLHNYASPTRFPSLPPNPSHIVVLPLASNPIKTDNNRPKQVVFPTRTKGGI